MFWMKVVEVGAEKNVWRLRYILGIDLSSRADEFDFSSRVEEPFREGFLLA